ncbi:MAG: 4-(cytidine 5'-diphospho)-2-C-methyl-D-erythritol kinase [Clostridia bacterium]|nr:4-(cytidine 5'-diphospho)-2-C-methyl-D-erythritol kinase [Clostridia bacterium]
MTEYAYAKINLFLSVGEKRADGYHNIDTVMHTVSLCDEVIIEKAPALRVFCDMDVSEKDNLAYKAATAFYNYTGITPSAEITVKKHIPSQAGLGGGSADAAAVLRGLDKLYGAGLSTATLASLGTPLGADVPFCVYGGKARCKGIGEKITVLEKDFLHLVIIKPNANCPTGKMYGELDKINREIPEYREGVYFNSFDGVCPQECRDATAFLSASGASVSMLSGSGSAVFGVFDTESAARNAAEKAKSVYPFAVYAHTI